MQIDENTLEIFNSSLERCQANPQFLTLFYQKFVISNSEIREKFSNTNMENQKMMLHASIYMIMLATQKNQAASAYLDKVAKRHSKTELNIRPGLYEIWLDTLLDTVSIIDPQYKNETGSAWKKVMTYGIDYMKSKYDTES
jgi:hemoglobin-like flavoprotein